MNQEQINIAKKIQNKNLKHGKLNPDVFYKEALERELGLKSESDNQNYNKMINIMKSIKSESVDEFNDWLYKNKEIFNKENEDTPEFKFYQMCVNKLKNMDLEPRVTDDDKNKIVINNKIAQETSQNATKNETEAETETKSKTKNKTKNRTKNRSSKILTKLTTKNKTSSIKNAEKMEANQAKPANATSDLNYDQIIKEFRRYGNVCFQYGFKKPLFITILMGIFNDGKFKDARDKVMKIINENSGKMKRVQELTTYFDSLKINQDEKYNEFDDFRDKLERYMDVSLPGFRKGDWFPDKDRTKVKRDLLEIIKSIGFRWSDYTKNKLNEILDKYGFRINYMTRRTGNTITFDNLNKEHKKELKDREDGKIETDPVNSKEFFSYDIHEIFNIVERGLETKLNNEVKNDIESIIRTETSNMINHLNITHGTSKVQSIIEQIENYLSSRIKNKTKKFKFTESNRYKLKELLSRFLNTKNNGQE